MSAAGRGKIHASDRAELNGKTLKKDGKDVTEKNDEEQAEAIRRSSSDICRIVSRIDWESMLVEVVVWNTVIV